MVVGRQGKYSEANESLARKAHCAATDFADMDERIAAKPWAVPCSCAT